MARQPPRHVEILVHVAAPSASADDARYRRLARAYLAFDPPARDALPADACSRGSPHSDGPEAQTRPVEATAWPAPELFYARDSQDLSFQSALDNRSSPRLRPLWRSRPPPASAAPLSATASAPLDSQDAPPPSSFCPPASQVGDSYPLPDAGVFTTTPTRILQRYLSNARASTGTPTSAASSPRAPSPGAKAIDVPSSPPLPSRHHEPPSQHHGGLVIPETPVAPPPLAPPPGRRTAAEPGCSALVDVTHVSSSFVSRPPASSPSRAESEPPPPPPKKPRLTGHESLVLVRSTSDAGPVMARARAAAALDHDDALDIRPPSPPAGTAHVDPASLVSDKLAKLARDLSSRYRPEPARRALEPLERGYWLLDCSGWPPQTRRDTWVFLTNYLGSGLAGWGVWCRRGADAAPRQQRQQQQQHAWIRLYCWACVAKHTYLLLYLASGRHVRATGAAWYGADGQAALEVPPSGGRRP
ncbi:hypothetical protein G6O67_002481 [Ophiocordyceps sinensis]|uniref:Uncharacterized protein n=1 Tax=Ophiocordyceps sinensis TaxID=72228 RepID=A0A8H4V7L3_9HYPO|nr:hypothetical protein G6O67_002481 [Ophiocordyceps sinensis]